MRITSGDFTTYVHSIIEGQGGVQGVMCDTVQVSLPGLPTPELMQSLLTQGFATDDGRQLSGYTGLAECRLTLYREPQDARDRAMQEMTALAEEQAERERKARAEAAQAQAQAAEATQREQAAQEQVQAKTHTLRSIATALPDELAVRHKDIYPAWDEVVQQGDPVAAGMRLRYEDGLYRVQQEHTPQEHQPPSVNTAALYTRIQPPGAVQAWVTGQSYAQGVRVTHNGKTWESKVPNNIWEPGAVGVLDTIWEEVRDE